MNKRFLKFLEGKDITKEQFAELDHEKMAGLFVEYNDATHVQIESLEIKKADATEILNLKTELNASYAKQFTALQKALKEQGLKLAEVIKGGKGEPTIGVSLKSILEDNKEHLAGIKAGDRQDWMKFEMPNLNLKVVGTMTIAGNVSGGNVPVEQRIAGQDSLASRQIRLLDIVSIAQANSNTISWVSQANKEGTAGQTAEGALKNQIDYDLVVDDETVKKTTAFIKVSKEMLEDIDFMQNEINNELTRELMKVVESQVYDGDGTGNNLNGIKTVSPAFAAGSFANTVDNANIVDVLTAAVDQIMIAEQPMPNWILMNPSDVTSLKFAKVSTTDKRYVERLINVGGQMSLDGIPIIPTTLVTQDDYLIGSFDLATVYQKGAPEIAVGLSDDDFVNNLVTILIEWRGACVVRTNTRTAFVEGDFTTDKAALETP